MYCVPFRLIPTEVCSAVFGASGWAGKQTILHLGAVDHGSEVFVNGKSGGVHKDGYDPFSYDITPFLNGNGPQELIVRVFDPTNNDRQLRGVGLGTPRAVLKT